MSSGGGPDPLDLPLIYATGQSNQQVKILKYLFGRSVYCVAYTASSTVTESVGNETMKSIGVFCLVIGTDRIF
jgi:hypothetical protein